MKAIISLFMYLMAMIGFAYFMRRLAERPQNLSLAVKEFVKPAGLKRVGIIAALGATVMLGLSTIKKLCRK